MIRVKIIGDGGNGSWYRTKIGVWFDVKESPYSVNCYTLMKTKNNLSNMLDIQKSVSTNYYSNLSDLIGHIIMKDDSLTEKELRKLKLERIVKL